MYTRNKSVQKIDTWVETPCRFGCPSDFAMVLSTFVLEQIGVKVKHSNTKSLQPRCETPSMTDTFNLECGVATTMMLPHLQVSRPPPGCRRGGSGTPTRTGRRPSGRSRGRPSAGSRSASWRSASTSRSTSPPPRGRPWPRASR